MVESAKFWIRSGNLSNFSFHNSNQLNSGSGHMQAIHEPLTIPSLGFAINRRDSMNLHHPNVPDNRIRGFLSPDDLPAWTRISSQQQSPPVVVPSSVIGQSIMRPGCPLGQIFRGGHTSSPIFSSLDSSPENFLNTEDRLDLKGKGILEAVTSEGIHKLSISSRFNISPPIMNDPFMPRRFRTEIDNRIVGDHDAIIGPSKDGLATIEASMVNWNFQKIHQSSYNLPGRVNNLSFSLTQWKSYLSNCPIVYSLLEKYVCDFRFTASEGTTGCRIQDPTIRKLSIKRMRDIVDDADSNEAKEFDQNEASNHVRKRARSTEVLRTPWEEGHRASKNTDPLALSVSANKSRVRKREE